jgi:2-keto-4-pentenoate hydratase/2-oxohepta-3-ene-1,7-dioic acid hydratase in catechol pathway
VVMGRRARGVPEGEALDYVQGLTVGNDVTAREFQTPGSQWTRAKGYDTFAPIGPCLVHTTEWSGRKLETRVNGRVVQSAVTDQLIVGIPKLIAVISAVMTLEPGDVILTGTPAGVGAMNDGDVIEVEIEGIGCLCNVVVSAAGDVATQITSIAVAESTQL